MKNSLALIAAGMVTASVYALPDYEPFADATGSGGTSYTIGGNLIGQTTAQGLTWVAAGTGAVQPTIQVGNLTVSGLPTPVGNSLRLVPGTGLSARLPIGAPITSGSIYYSFALDVTTLGTTLSSTSGGFFAGFNNTTAASTGTPGTMGTRLYLRLATGGFNIGLNKAAGVATDTQWSPTVFTAGSTIFVVGSYDYGTFAGTADDSSRLWINPSSLDFGAGTAPTATLTAAGGTDLATAGLGIQSFVFMQRANTLQPNEMITDELRIGTSWADVTAVPEPATATLSGLGLLALIACYRRSRR